MGQKKMLSTATLAPAHVISGLGWLEAAHEHLARAARFRKAGNAHEARRYLAVARRQFGYAFAFNRGVL